MKKYLRFFFLFFLVLTVFTLVYAQCPMCSMTAETNMVGGGRAGRGLNSGIIYLLMAPYVLVGGIAFYWFRYRRKDDAVDPVNND